ncbi:hypothetical protein [Corynebacterium sp. MSK310]|uniref:hypothetical protein n=1 Tax=Corynebacterium sp. MSK310 TaxID=3050223 RepID=UPI002550153C|nr:hypothetical protein [Corynebacterium sp. MSK310]MDK8475502.1 hypothetical protein [Corynebacterium sp. MSK310]
MSINHDHLHRIVTEMEQGVAATTKYTWLDLAQEILRMRGELTSLQEEARSAAKIHTPGPNVQRVFNALDTTIHQILGDHDE